MGTTFYFEWEIRLMECIQSFMIPALEKFMEFITFFGEDLCMVLFLGLVYWVFDKKKGTRLGMTIMLTDLSFPLAKNIALRRRPYMDHPSIKRFVLIDKSADPMDIAAQGYSFPSGHSANSAALTTSLALLFKKKALKIIAVVLPLLAGISRFALGVHYPTDVLVGWIFGYAAAFLVYTLSNKFKNERVLYYMIFGISLVGIFFCKSNDYFSALGSTLGMLLGTAFEKKYVNFSQTKNPITAILRVAGGAAIYLALNTLMKMPFSAELLASASYTQFAIRFVRYAIILFVETAIYPMCFGKINSKKTKQ